MLKAPLRILIVAALCVIALITLVVRESLARDTGSEVLLAMEAVDPRSLLSGHYVIVDLREGDDHPCPALPDPSTVEQLNEWVALAPAAAGTFSVVGGAPTRAEATELAPVVARGTFQCVDAGGLDGAAAQRSWTMLDLGIDRFHINQAEAERIDRILREQRVGEARVYAIVSIGGDGHARLKGLMVDDERIELSWL